MAKQLRESTTKLQRKFIEMRAEGYSYTEIAEATNTSKSVLSKWQRTFDKEIKDETRELVIEVQREFEANKIARISALSQMSMAIKEEICNRDLTDVTTARLFRMFTDVAAQLRKEEVKDPDTSIKLSYSLDNSTVIDTTSTDA